MSIVDRYDEDEPVFEKRFFAVGAKYKIICDEIDAVVVEKWKGQVDEIIEQTKNLAASDEQNQERIKMEKSIGAHSSETDITLYAIGKFIVDNQNRDRHTIRMNFLSAMKLLKGGTHRISEFDTAYNTCIDAAAVAKVLADAYGISGNVINNPKDPQPHHYWQEETNDDTGRIIDTFFAEGRNGFLRNADEEDAARERFLTVERKVIGRKIERYKKVIRDKLQNMCTRKM